MESLYEAAGGDSGLFALADAWHHRVLADEVVSHAFQSGVKADHSERLAAYWAEALGGPAAYTSAFGDETEVVRIHSGNGQHEDMDRRAIDCFDAALDDVGIGVESRLGRVLHDYFTWTTLGPMDRYHASAEDVPDGLELTRWSWDGRVS